MRSPIGGPMYWLPIVALILISANAVLLRPYLADQTPAEAQPLTMPAEPTVGVTPAFATATAAPIPTQTAVPGPPPAYDAVLRDAKRQLDLAAIESALEAHRTAHGTYPSTHGEAQTLCERADDAGCTLLTTNPSLSTEDSTSFSYWYVSDGLTFTLYAPAETVSAGCSTSSLPGWLADGIFYCVTSKGAGH